MEEGAEEQPVEAAAPDPDPQPEPVVLEAGHVYLLMEDEFRISRNARASWYLKHLNTTIRPKQDPTEKSNTSDELNRIDILSVTPRSIVSQDVLKTQPCIYKVSPSTTVTFLAKKYRFVFILDVSPSVAAVDLCSSQVLYDEIFCSFRNAIRGLIKPFRLPDGDQELRPHIFITVIAHTPLISCKTNQVLIQGCMVNEDNVEALVELLRTKLDHFESSMAEHMSDLVNVDLDDGSSHLQLTGGLFEDIVDRSESGEERPDVALYLMTPEISFINMLRHGILALQLLPENSAAGIVVVTDGVIGLPEATLFESLMVQLRHNTIAMSFLPVGGASHMDSGLGHVRYTELMQFLAASTFGAFLTNQPDLKESPPLLMNVYHQGLLTWSFQKALSGAKLEGAAGLPFLEPLNEDLAWGTRIPTFLTDERRKKATPMTNKKHQDKTLNTSIHNLISCRLREGYIIKEIALTKAESQIEVLLVLPWRENVFINYLAVSTWPLSSGKRQTRVELNIEGSYDFLHDVTCPMTKRAQSPYRTALVKQYWQALQGMTETDHMLVHLQSFSSNQTFYKVPESVQNGVPLFYLPQNSMNPQVNIQHGTKDSALNQFATFWKLVLSLDANIWQKWMHAHRIGMILEHDTPLGKHLHTPNSSGRFHSVACQQALVSLHAFLAHWSTFVLMEGHSYIKLLWGDPDKPPMSFLVLRVASKAPCLVLRLAFLGGTQGTLRKEIMHELEEKISQLTFPQRGTQKDDMVTRKPSGNRGQEDGVPEHRPPLQRRWADIPCCILMQKPIEKILIRYDRLPHDFLRLEAPLPLEQPYQAGTVVTANRIGSNMFMTLARYLHHQRWVWAVQHGPSESISIQAAGRILSTLTKIRLQEGFHFANARSGIINMVLEIELKNPDQDDDDASSAEGSCRSDSGLTSSYPCVVQYIIFPPHTNTSRESMSDYELDEMATAEADGELQIATECWVEPQYGLVVNSSPERKQLDSLDFKQLSQALFPTDLECISTMLTFEHLITMCQDAHIPSPFMLGGFPPPSRTRQTSMMLPPCSRPDDSVQVVPFAFDLLRLLPKCQQVELLFSTFMQGYQIHGLAQDCDVSQSSMPRLRSDTLTAENPSSQPFESSSSPNDTLFNLFLESVNDMHNRELHLSDTECEQLVGLIRQRERDLAQHPLPFIVDEPTLADEEEPYAESTMSVATNYSSGTAPLSVTKSTGSLRSAPLKSTGHSSLQRRVSTGSPLRMPPSKLHNVKSDTDINEAKPPMRRRASAAERISECPLYESLSPISSTGDMEKRKSLSKMDVDKMPRVVARWRCFVKSVNGSHLLICLVPASYCDLRLLVQGQVIMHPPDPDPLATEADHSGNPAPGSVYESVDGVECVEHVQPLSPGHNAKPGYTHSPSPSGLSPNFKYYFDEVPSFQCPDSTDVLNAEDPPGADDDPETVTEGEAQPGSADSITADISTPCCPPPDTVKSLPIPVYIYSCPMTCLHDQLVNKWTYCKPPDIFQDLTVKHDAHETSIHSRAESVDRSPRRRTDSEHMLDLLRMTRDETEQDELKEHCTLVSEHFFRNFVSALYRSLLERQPIVCPDVDAAINGICEESLPMEIDISQYTQCVCGHVRRLVEKAHTDAVSKMINEEAEKDPFNCGTPLLIRAKVPGGEGGVAPPPSPSALCLPISVLDMETDCEAERGLHNLIRRKFTTIMERDFKPVPSNPDFFIYCPQQYQQEEQPKDNMLDISNKTNLDIGNISSERGNLPSAEESDFFASDEEPEDRQHSNDSMVSEKDIASLMSEDSDDEDLEAAEYLYPEDDDMPAPLFIYLMCSLHSSGGMLKSEPIRTLPTCLNELRQCLTDMGPEVDINSLRVTLDVICLTLPPEADLEEPAKRPCFTRMASFTSHMSNISSSPSDVEDEKADRVSTLDGSNYPIQSVSDPLQKLPKRQEEAVRACKDQLLWLLQDEIASAMRLLTPVTPETLDMVAMHVKSSVEKPRCIAEELRLQFVYGAERSLQPFIENFECMSLPGYHLRKEAGYYYLYMDRVLAAFSTAMLNMSHSSSHTQPKYDPLSPRPNKNLPLNKDSPLSPPQSKDSPLSAAPSKDSPLSPTPGKDPPLGAPRDSPQSDDLRKVEVSGVCQRLELGVEALSSDSAPVEGKDSPREAGVLVDNMDNDTSGKLSTAESQARDFLDLIDQEAADMSTGTPDTLVGSDIKESQLDMAIITAGVTQGPMEIIEMSHQTMVTMESEAAPTDSMAADALTVKCIMEAAPGEPCQRISVGEDSNPLDNSVEVLAAEKDLVVDVALDQDAFRPEDIRISVIRPSPVKEIPQKVVEDRDEKTDADVSENTSGSSIQVLDDAPCMDNDVASDPSTLDTESSQLTSRSLEEKLSSSLKGPPDHESSPKEAAKSRRRSLPEGPTHESLMHSRSDTTQLESHGLRQLSPISLGAETDKKNIKRVHSSASFEKYRGQVPARRGSKSGRDTPQCSTDQTPNRSRHHSGLQTPQSDSMFGISSRSSVGEEGYDGDSDSSAGEEEDTMLSFNEMAAKGPLLPNFWLIMKIVMDRVDVFFHTRDNGDADSGEFEEQKQLYNRVITSIHEICRTVNQHLLLQDLNDTRICNKLLVPEADEDVHWSQDKLFNLNSRRRHEDSDDSDTDMSQGRYLEASLHFMPGHFACNAVWRTEMPLHPRLKAVSSKKRSRGVQALMTVLDKFSVTNRKNMFVIKETNGEVFYLRLEEQQGEQNRQMSLTESFNFGESRRWDEDTSLASRSSSLLSLPVNKKETEQLEDPNNPPSPRRFSVRESERDEDCSSINTSRSLTSKKPNDVIVLTAHGICAVGAEISHDLVQLLQKKLDDAVLDILTVTLARNNMSKLSPEDVHFIQPLSCSNHTVRLTIPSPAVLHKFALRYYLRQNLLQFLYTPKYADHRQEAIFLDVSQSKAPPIPENEVFLYNRPQHAGGKGIACLQLTFVDGRGNPVTLLGCPAPSPYAYCDGLEPDQFSSQVDTRLYHIKQGSRVPESWSSAETAESSTPGDGPPALVQFTIWERGDVDLPQLTELLLLAMKQALVDLVTEYRLLTAPICDIPLQYTRDVESLTTSMPASPLMSAAIIPEARSLPQPVKKQGPSEAGTRTPKEKSGGFALFRSKVAKDKPAGSPTPVSSQVSPPPEGTLVSQKERDLREKIAKYEAGERGHLQDVYQNVLQDWFLFGEALNVPSLQEARFELQSRFALDYVLHDFQNSIIKNIAPDTTLRQFLQVVHQGVTYYLPYTPYRAPVQPAESRLESSLDMTRPGQNTMPGQPRHFIVIGRNLRQWRQAMGNTTVEEEKAKEEPPRVRKGRKSSQKFISLDPAMVAAQEKTPDGIAVPSVQGIIPPPTPVSASSAAMGYGVAAGSYVDNPDIFVPRQKFLLMVITDKEFTLYTYNWANEHHSSLVSQLSRLVQWHNARSHLLACLLSQKAGLFQHRLFGDLSPDPTTNEQNPFVGAAMEHDLVRNLRPTSQFQHLHRGSVSSTGAPGRMRLVPCLEDVYRDCHPRRPLHRTTMKTYPDPLLKHGRQMLELRRQERLENDKRHKLEQLYLIWQQRMGTHMPIGDDVLESLKMSSRLVHTVATPVLFSPLWRRVVLGKNPAIKRKTSQTSMESKPRSRHSSGTSMRSRRSDSQDGKKRTASGNSNTTDSSEVTMRSLSEEGWHSDLRNSFTSQYVQYLQSLAFVQINTCSITPGNSFGRGFHKRPVEKTASNSSTTSGSSSKPRQVIHPSYTYLQKTLPGGIMLIELGFKEVYFCIHVYTFDCSRLPVGKNVNPQLAVIFTDECDKFKDLTHAHSFAYDFHLRMLQMYLAGRQLVFKHGYHLTAFLQDFIHIYPYVPSYSRNYVYVEEITIEHTNSPGNQLFDYMLNHDKIYGMRAVRMNPIHEEESPLDLGSPFLLVTQRENEAIVKDVVTLQDSEYALVTQYPCHAQGDEYESLKLRPLDYDVGLVVTHEGGSRGMDSDRHQLRLKYYVLLTSKKDLFPKHTLEKKLGVFKAASANSFPANLQLFKQVADTEDESTEEVKTPQPMPESAPQPVPVAQQVGLRQEQNSWQEAVNYLGFSNKQQAAGYELLLGQVAEAKEKIKNMVDSAMLQCRRDLLWQRMLLSQAVGEEEGRRKRRSERQGDADDLLLVRPSFAEFQEMLELVTRVSLDEIDERLAPLLTMTLSWYQGLARVLTTKYSEHHRSFISQDGRVHYVVVLNPKYLDAFMLLEVDLIANKADICAIYREPVVNDGSGQPSLPVLALQEHLEEVVNACCFHMWSGLVS